VPTQKEDAEVLRYGLIAGTVSVAEVVAWADRVIAAEAAPGGTLLDVAMAGRMLPADVAGLLKGLPGDADRIRVMRRVLWGMLQALRQDPDRGEDIAGTLYRLATGGDLPSAAFGSDPFGLDDAFELARKGHYGTRTDAIEGLRTYLEQHAEPPPE